MVALLLREVHYGPWLGTVGLKAADSKNSAVVFYNVGAYLLLAWLGLAVQVACCKVCGLFFIPNSCPPK